MRHHHKATNPHPETGYCQLTGKAYPLTELLPGYTIRGPLTDLIRQQHPDWDPNGYISIDKLKEFRAAYINGLFKDQKREITALEQEVVESVQRAEVLSKNMVEEGDQQLRYGDRLADRIATFGGSWTFIIVFLSLLALWIAINSLALLWHPFDPYPFILLNLILSCVAALQAPVIMMSQNRQEAKDRARALHDYQINLKAEIEIRQLHEKLDNLILQQSQRMFDLQQVQIDLLEELLDRKQKQD